MPFPRDLFDIMILPAAIGSLVLLPFGYQVLKAGSAASNAFFSLTPCCLYKRKMNLEILGSVCPKVHGHLVQGRLPQCYLTF